jgi:peptide-methionine (S)-S-oxide reductase
MIFATFAASLGGLPAYADGLPQPTVDVPLGKPGELRKAVFAGGCFWCTEAVFQQLEGVTEVMPGYSGGSKETANYEDVCTGTTGHAEAMQITYDASKISFGQLLRVFMTMHDPTTKDRQGPDVGPQYRSAVFYNNDEEKKVTEAYIKTLDAAKSYPNPVVTTLEPLKAFYPAEEYHRDYAARNPRQAYILQQALPKIEKLRKKVPDEVKPPSTQPGE